jgi:hypothetical protein
MRIRIHNIELGGIFNRKINLDVLKNNFNKNNFCAKR